MMSLRYGRSVDAANLVTSAPSLIMSWTLASK